MANARKAPLPIVESSRHGSTPAKGDDPWWSRGSCASLDPELVNKVFFSTKPSDVEYAKRICRGCPVVSECAEDALRRESKMTGDIVGVVGGMSAEERRQIMAPARKKLPQNIIVSRKRGR